MAPLPRGPPQRLPSRNSSHCASREKTTFLASPYGRFISGHTLVVDGANWQRRHLTNPEVVTVRDQMGLGPFDPDAKR